MQVGDVYENIYTGELMTVDIVADIAGLIRFIDSNNQLVIMGLYNLKKSWKKQ